MTWVNDFGGSIWERQDLEIGASYRYRIADQTIGKILHEFVRGTIIISIWEKFLSFDIGKAKKI